MTSSSEPIVTLAGGPSYALLITAESCARRAARIVELDPDPDARREASILILAAQRIRARRLAA
jgi:hypothetical protein